ncbi:MAG: hypothetical protein QOE05_1444 [Actinomycetota bacterium]|nr:hypothetical protein [Actinomycetota bacterium]
MTLPRLLLDRVRRRRTAALAALALSAVVAGAAHADPTVPVATIAVTGCPNNGVQVPNDYLGLSVEWSMMLHWFGTSAAGAVQPTVNLLDSLETSPDHAGVLRIGGNSQDLHLWRPDRPATDNKLFEGVINKGMVDALFTVAERSGWKVVLGLNLRRNNPAEAVALTRYALSRDRTHKLLAVEIGNEPTVYFGSDTTAYIARVYSYVQALDADPVTSGVAIAGPSLANRADLALVASMRQSYGPRMPFVSWHHYANRPTLTGLLSEQVSKEWRDRIDAVQSAAENAPTRMDEGNSVGTGGMNRVSNVMGSAAWQTDAMITGAAAGLAGYHAHAWDGYYFPKEKRESWYTPFVVRGGLVYPRPTFYSLALLKELPGKRFCNAVSTVPAGDGVKSWTLIDPATSRLLVYAVNKADGAASDVTLTTPLQYAGTASVSRIGDPDGCGGKKSNIEGARLPTQGAYAWTPSTVQPVGPSAYSIRLEPCQAALIEIDANPQ